MIFTKAGLTQEPSKTFIPLCPSLRDAARMRPLRFVKKIDFNKEF